MSTTKQPKTDANAEALLRAFEKQVKRNYEDFVGKPFPSSSVAGAVAAAERKSRR